MTLVQKTKRQLIKVIAHLIGMNPPQDNEGNSHRLNLPKCIARGRCMDQRNRIIGESPMNKASTIVTLKGSKEEQEEIEKAGVTWLAFLQRK